MKKYYIGLIIIGLMVLGLTGFTVFQASAAKQDNQTSRRAQDIANKLNNYVASHGAPESLEEANIKDVPKTITYTKKDNDKYEFCVTYKHSGSEYDSVGLGEILTGSLQRQMYSGYDDYSSYDDSSYTPSSLYLPYTHKAGKTCQTVQAYNYNQYNKTTDPYIYPDFDSACDGGICAGTGTSTTSGANDTERKTDIKALHGQVEAYYAQNGYYPTLANLNDSAWRSTNMKGLDKEALHDPKGTGYTLTSAAAKNSYSYSVSNDANKPCDNKAGNECTFYTLSATLDNGSLYTKISLN